MKEIIYHDDGTTTVVDHPDPPAPSAEPQPTKEELLAKIAELTAAVQALP